MELIRSYPFSMLAIALVIIAALIGWRNLRSMRRTAPSPQKLVRWSFVLGVVFIALGLGTAAVGLSQGPFRPLAVTMLTLMGITMIGNGLALRRAATTSKQ
jgi:hypothetical protein